ncbi:MAG: glutathione S-transferase family protein [Burkholderiales bacterium]|nr:glutathione S-transferase family protein [Burkholderiales bacterium]
MRALYMSPLSPYTRKVRVMLAEKGLAYENKPVAMDRLQNDYGCEINPCGRVPALDDNGRILFESNVILDYLLTQYPGTPEDAPRPALVPALVRAEHRWDDLQVLSAIETLLNSGLTMLRFGTHSGVVKDPPYLEREHKRVHSILDWLDKRATPEGFVPGWFSVLDLNLVVSVQWVDFRKLFDWRGRSNIDRLVAFHAQRPTIPPSHPSLPA